LKLYKFSSHSRSLYIFVYYNNARAHSVRAPTFKNTQTNMKLVLFECREKWNFSRVLRLFAVFNKLHLSQFKAQNLSLYIFGCSGESSIRPEIFRYTGLSNKKLLSSKCGLKCDFGIPMRDRVQFQSRWGGSRHLTISLKLLHITHNTWSQLSLAIPCRYSDKKISPYT
jgi:hypothetical protein